MSYSSIKSNWFTIHNFASLSSFCLHRNRIPLHGRIIFSNTYTYLDGNVQPTIAGSSKRWGAATACEQDHNVHIKPSSKQCCIHRSGPNTISCPCCLCRSGFAILAAFSTFMTNIGLDFSRQIVPRSLAEEWLSTSLLSELSASLLLLRFVVGLKVQVPKMQCGYMWQGFTTATRIRVNTFLCFLAFFQLKSYIVSNVFYTQQ